MTFERDFPAPWHFDGSDIYDVTGYHVTKFDHRDLEQLVLWRGIVRRINAHDALVKALKAAAAAKMPREARRVAREALRAIAGKSA